MGNFRWTFWRFGYCWPGIPHSCRSRRPGREGARMNVLLHLLYIFLLISIIPAFFCGMIGIGLLFEWRRCKRLGKHMFFDTKGCKKG